MSDERLAGVEARMAAIEARLERLEAGADLRPESAAVAEADEERLRSVLASVREPGSFLSLAGRSFLILGGAFLVRAVTEAGWLPTLAGVFLGGAYAGIWLALADRSGGRGRADEATTYAALAIVCGLPLAWEGAARFGVLPPALATALVVALAAAALAIAERRGLRVSIWITSLAALVALAALTFSTYALVATAGGAVALGLAAVWLAYGRRGWTALRWPTAIAADVAVSLAIFLVTRAEGPPASYGDLSLASVWVLAVAFAAAYLGAFTLRTFRLGQDIGLFVAVQGFVATWIGLGGAASVARRAERGLAATGGVAMLVAFATYAAAIVLLERRPELRRSFRFATSLALLLLVWGSTLLASGDALAWLLSVLAVAAAALSIRYGRASLAVHAALLAAATGVASGLHRGAAAAFAGVPDALAAIGPRAWLPPAIAASLVYLLLWRGGDLARPARRAAAALAAVVAALAIAVFVIVVAASSAGLAATPPALALLRVVVISAAAVLLAALRRFDPFAPLAGVPLAALVAAAATLGFGLARNGGAAALFAGFAIFGLALLAVARLGRRAAPGT